MNEGESQMSNQTEKSGKTVVCYGMTLLVILSPLWLGCRGDGEEEEAHVAVGNELTDSIPGEVPPLGNEAETPEKIIGDDSAEMVLIPAGEFEMGTAEAELDQLVQDFSNIGLNVHGLNVKSLVTPSFSMPSTLMCLK